MKAGVDVVQFLLVDCVLDGFDRKPERTTLLEYVLTFASCLERLLFVKLRQLIFHAAVPARVLYEINVRSLGRIFD